jgi:hypothetical protein
MPLCECTRVGLAYTSLDAPPRGPTPPDSAPGDPAPKGRLLRRAAVGDASADACARCSPLRDACRSCRETCAVRRCCAGRLNAKGLQTLRLSHGNLLLPPRILSAAHLAQPVVRKAIRWDVDGRHRVAAYLAIALSHRTLSSLHR